MAFIWDSNNVSHIAEHDVLPNEAEEALTDPNRLSTPSYRGADGERRTRATGETEDGRLLVVVFTVRDGAIRVVTARPVTPSERIAYGR